MITLPPIFTGRGGAIRDWTQTSSRMHVQIV